MKGSTAIYPGTFDPITFGHIDLAERALKIFGKVVVGVTTNPGKKPLFSLEERVGLAKASLKGLENSCRKVEVRPFDSLLVEFAKSQGAEIIIRGLREMSDFPSEFQNATVNRKLAPGIETIFIVTSEKYFYLNSTIVKEIARFNGKLSEFVPVPVEKALREKLGK